MKICLLILTALPALAQQYVVVSKSTTLNAAAETITIQQPVTGAKTVEFKSLYVECSVICTVTIERDGNPATGTALTPVALNPREKVPVAQAFYSSNASVGYVESQTTIQANSYLVYDMTGFRFTAQNNPGLNLSIRTSSITGTVKIIVKWTEL